MGGGGTLTAGGEAAPVAVGGAPVVTAAGGAATAIVAQVQAETGAGAAAGEVTAGGEATGVATEDTAEAARGAAIKVEKGGVTVIIVEDTGDTAAAETGATPDDAKVIDVITLFIGIFTISLSLHLK